MSQERNRALDGLRGVAVSLVVIDHAGWLPFLGNLGVAIFFTLSGYLITSLLVKEHGSTGRIHLLRFWQRRFVRLFPSLIVVLLAIGAVSVAVYHRLDASVIPSLLYVQNWAMIAAGAGANHWTLGSAWSLAVEEQFYVVWPLLLAGGLWASRGHVTARGALALAMGAVILSTVARVWATLIAPDGMHLYYGTDVRADGLLVGAALALARQAGAVRTVRYSGASGFGLLIAAAVVSSAPLTTASALVLPLMVEFGVSLVIIEATSNGPAVGALSARPMVWLGGISYSLYLWHTVVIEAAVHVAPAVPMVLVVAAGIGAAWISHRVTEVPYLALRDRLRTASTAPDPTRKTGTPALEGSAA